MDPGVSRAFLGKDDGELLSEELMENWREMEILPNSVVDNIITLSRVLGDLEYISTPQYLFSSRRSFYLVVSDLLIIYIIVVV